MIRILPTLPDAEKEADAYTSWENIISQPSDWDDDPGAWAEWALEQGLERYKRLRGLRQATMNMGTVMLWHLLEQQMLGFHRRQVLSAYEEGAALNDPKVYKKLCSLNEFESRLKLGLIFSCR